MSAPIKEFLVGIGFEVDDKGLNNFQAKVADFAKRATLIVGGVTAGFWALSKAIGGTADKFNALGDLSGRVGANAVALEKLNYVAANSASSAQAVATSLENLAARAGEAKLGVGRGALIFEAFGLSATDANGNVKETTALLADVGALMKDLSHAEQLGIANKLGIDKTLIQTITQGSDALEKEFDNLYAQTGADVEQLAKDSTAYNDAMRRLGYAFTTFKHTIIGGLLEPLALAGEDLRKFLTDFLGSIAKTLRPILNGIGLLFSSFLKILTTLFKAIANVVKWVFSPFVKLFNAMPLWVKAIGALTIAWKTMGAAFLASPIGLVVALGAAIAALYDDFQVWKAGGKSLIDWEAWEPAINTARAAIESFCDVVSFLFQTLFAVFDALVSLLKGDFSAAWNAAKVYVDSVLKSFNALIGVAKGVGNTLGNIFGGAVAWGKSLFGVEGGGGGVAPSKSLLGGDFANKTSNSNVKVDTQIIVQGAANPQATAQEVGKLQNNVYLNAARNAGAAAW